MKIITIRNLNKHIRIISKPKKKGELREVYQKHDLGGHKFPLIIQPACEL